MGSPPTVLHVTDEVTARYGSPEVFFARQRTDDDPTILLPVIATRPPLAWSQWEPPQEATSIGPAAYARPGDRLRDIPPEQGTLADRAVTMWLRLTGRAR